MLRPKTGAVALIVLAACSAAAGQSQGEKPVKLGVNLVTLDVSVTDKHRRPVGNLTEKDFVVTEDGVEQRIESFAAGGHIDSGSKTRDQGAPRKEGGQAPAEAQRRRFAGYRFVSLAIDNTSVEAANRDSVVKAITWYVKERIEPDDLVAIYSVGNSLSVVQPFTADRARLLAAAGKSVSGQLATEAATTREAAARDAELAARTEGSGSPVENADRASRNAVDNFEALADYFQAQSLFRGLRAIIDVQRSLIGTKSLILFSQGSAVSFQSGYAVDGVISAANSANVSIYVIDAAGLSVGEAPRGIDPRGNLGLPSRSRPDVYGGEDPTNVRDGMNGIERALKRSLSEGQPNRFGLVSRLANETGGIAITNNNDLAAALDSADSDLRTHYTIAYAPKNSDFNGRFRQIAVKVSNSELVVRTRRGYYAVKAEVAISEEASVQKLAADAGAGIQAEFPLEMSAAYFLRGRNSYLVPIMLRIPGAAVQSQKKGDRYHLGLDCVITVKDSTGAVVSTFGRDYPLDLDEDQNKRLAGSTIPLRQNVRLGPGTYVIVAAIRDAASGKTSMARRGITLPAYGGGPHLSSIVLAHQAEQMLPSAEAQLAKDVLAYGKNIVLMPTDNQFDTGQRLLLFFRAYPATGGETHPLLMAAGFIRDGKIIHRTPTIRVTQTPDSPGAGIPLLSPLKLAELAPGEYTLTVQLLDETTKEQEVKEAHFTLTK